MEFENAGPYMSKAIQLVREEVWLSFDKSDPEVPYFEVYVVWFNKQLQNWKALVSTTLPDQKYYEVTYNGDKKETYIDIYLKVKNVVAPDGLPCE
jgi:hypothetical protein